MSLRDIFSRTKKHKLSEVEQRSKRQTIVEENLNLVHIVARKISSRLPSYIDLDDLVSNGVIGLIDAVEKYDASRDNKFRTYAEFRIRGSILDGLRAQDWVPRSIRDKAKKIDKAVSHLEKTKGRRPQGKEIAEHLNISLNDFYDLLNNTKPVKFFSMHNLSSSKEGDQRSLLNIIENFGGHNPANLYKMKVARQSLMDTIDKLPERQRKVLHFYYYEGLNLKEIGQLLGVTESRVSQLHAQAIMKLKVSLGAQKKREAA